MVLRFIEGFELNAASSTSNDQYYERKLETVSGTPGSTTGHLVGLSLQSSSYNFRTPEFTDQDVWVIHWAWNLDLVDDINQNARIGILKAGTEQLSVDIRSFTGSNNSDRFYVDLKRGATTLETAGPFWANKWYTFELKVTIHQTTGAYELKVDGVSQISDTGVNTADTGAGDADQFQFVLDNGARNMQLDHVIIIDDTGATNNDFFGPSLVMDVLPNADGDDTDWTPNTGSNHYDRVNEAMPNNNVLSTEDPKRVSTETVSDVDRWHMQHLADDGLPTGTTILGLVVETCAAMEASGSLDLRAVFKDTTAATAEGTSFTVSDTVLAVYSQFWEVNPATAAGWTVATIDAGQFGIKLQA